MIEFKEGDVFYAGGAIYEYWSKDKLVSGFGGKADIMPLQEAISYKDFQLNEPSEGWFIPKSELDTEEKYNKAVEVFGLFGFSRTSKYALNYRSFMESSAEDGLACSEDLLIGVSEYSNTIKLTYTFAQLMAIGELKRKMDERDLTARIKAQSLKPVTQGDVFNELGIPQPQSNRRNKSKQAYDILKGMGIEYDLVKQQWYKKVYVND